MEVAGKVPVRAQARRTTRIPNSTSGGNGERGGTLCAARLVVACRPQAHVSTVDVFQCLGISFWVYVLLCSLFSLYSVLCTLHYSYPVSCS